MENETNTGTLTVPGTSQPPRSGPVVLLMAGGALGWIVANRLAKRFPGLVILEENPESKASVIRRRARLLGWPSALGQAACGVALRALDRRASARRHAICKQHSLQPQPAAQADVRRIPSVNSPQCRALLAELQPSVVAVYGTRILSRQTLAAVGAPFINYHAGINPKYRGQHPAYWALANRDAANAGVTVHLVDHGVDTGGVLYQAQVKFEPGDTIATYQWAQMPVALPLFEHAIADGVVGSLRPCRVSLPSAQYFPPTLWTYLWIGMARSVW